MFSLAPISSRILHQRGLYYSQGTIHLPIHRSFQSYQVMVLHDMILSLRDTSVNFSGAPISAPTLKNIIGPTHFEAITPLSTSPLTHVLAAASRRLHPPTLLYLWRAIHCPDGIRQTVPTSSPPSTLLAIKREDSTQQHKTFPQSALA